MAGRAEGKVAFITGAARGQGRSHAARLAEEGADIIAVDLLESIPHVAYPGATQEDMDETVRLVEKHGRRIIARKCDVRDLAGLTAIADEGAAEFGHIDTVVANAGIMIMQEWHETTPEIWDAVIGTNLTGVWNTVMATAPHLVEHNGGSMILVSSAAGLKAQPFLNAYTASKHGVVGVMHAFAIELAAHNIRVNTLHPTGVVTPMVMGVAEVMPRLLEKYPQLAAMSQNMLPVAVSEEIDQSNAVLFLASDESRYTTSTTFAVDAGTTQY